MLDHGVAAFLTLGGVVLAVTGAEALYADRGHFGAWPIRFSWLVVALPALVLNYLGQAALILQHPRTIANPFLLLVPHGLRFPMVLLATAATIIASQAVITGSYSVARQAVQLGFLPRLKVLHTSKVEGQIYVPVINWALAAGVIVLVLGFRSSSRLADIYGVAVTGTFVLNTILFVAVARSLWRMSWPKLIPIAALFLVVELAFFASNLAKIAHGAWLPLAVGVAISVVMIIWRRGQVAVTRKRTEQEGSLQEFLARLAREQPPVKRVPSTAVFLSPGKETTPLALRTQVDYAGVLQEKVVIVSLDSVGSPTGEPRGSLRGDAARQRTLQGAPRDRQSRIRRGTRRSGRACAGAQAGPAGPEPRPRTRVVLPLPDPHRPARRTKHLRMAKAAVRRDGAQRRQPGRALRSPGGPHGRGRIADRAVSRLEAPLSSWRRASR